MSTISALSPTATAAAPSAADQAGMSLEKESFLKLLVAQISNQDPLKPQDSDQYMQQLTQFGTLEQLMNLNQGVGQLALGQLTANSQEALRFVGKDITAIGDTVDLVPGGEPEVSFGAPPGTETVKVTVLDEAGEEIYTAEVQPDATGRGTFRWPGVDMEGVRAADGRYRVSMEAEGEEGEPIPVDTFVRGKVTGVRFDQGFPELLVGERRLRMGDVVEVNEGG